MNAKKCWCHVCEDYLWNPASCNFENEKHSASIINDPAIMYDKAIQLYDKKNFNVRKPAKGKISMSYLHFH